MDGDGDLDTLSASQLDNKIAWYENRLIHRNAAFGAAATVTTSVVNVLSAAMADINGDGDVDLVSASSSDDKINWYENDGAPSPGWTMRTISSAADGAEYLAVADVNGDGDIDVLSASFNDDTIAWYENDGAAVPGWTERLITTAFDGAHAVEAADLDHDGDIDVIATSQPGEPIPGSSLTWYESDGAAVPVWTLHDITVSTPYQSGLATADLDRDGDVDFMTILSTSYVAWYENSGASPPAFTEHQIATDGVANGGRIVAADVDSDGDMDAVSAGYSASEIYWIENLGGVPLTWTQHSIPSTGMNFAVDAEDLDADGDVDFLSGSWTAGLVEWWENDGATDPGFTNHVIATSIVNPAAVAAGDVNGDGTADAIARSGLDAIVFWENRGGQFTLDTAVPAGLPASVPGGSATALLSIELTSNGRSGDSDVELATLELLLRDSSGEILSSDEANGLIERLRVHRDNGSGVFEPGLDPVVTTVETLEFSPQVIEFAPGDPRVRVGPAQNRTFFMVVEASLNPITLSTGGTTFRLIHDTESGSKARDASTGALLQLEFTANEETGMISVLPDVTSPFVTSVFPTDHAVDVSLATNVVLFFNEAVDPASAASGVTLYVSGIKVPGRVTANGSAVSIDPESPLSPSADYLVQVTPQLRDRTGNAAVPFVSTFDTAASAGTGDIAAGEIGESAGGATLPGGNTDDNSGFAAAALGDVNATAASGGIADLIIGAPNTDAGAVDAGKATLIFGSPGLQSNAGAVLSLTYRTGTAADFVGETVAQAGDLNGDTVRDFLIGAPHSDQAFGDAGVVYLLFGDPGLDELAPATFDLDNLATCAAPTLCGVKFLGAAAGDLAGASLSWAGDINGDGHDDVVIGAPGASPGGKAQAGRVYLVYGPLVSGTIILSQVGITVPGLVLNGETAGDNFGAAVSMWLDNTGDGFDDLLIGAPGSTSLDANGVSIPDAGYVYAIQGGKGPGRLDDTATPGVIEMSRVASGGSDQVAGMVFIGSAADGNIGRSLTGAVDIDGNGVNDILIAGNGVAFSIAGDDPKTVVGATGTGGTGGGGGLRAGLFDAQRDFHAVMYVTGNTDPLTVGAAGDLNNDGYGDFIIGSPLADTLAGTDAGRAYVILGSPVGGGVVSLDDVGSAIDGFIIEGANAGDNLGASVGGGFDLNADGVDDGLVGAPFADTAPATPNNAGETYVISPLRPDEVVGLGLTSLGGGITRLEWTVPDLAATYNVYRGLLSTLVPAGMVKTSNTTWLACGIATDADADLLPDRDDATLPPLGDAWFYLVTAENLQGEGPLGPAGHVPQRINDLQCP